MKFLLSTLIYISVTVAIGQNLLNFNPIAFKDGFNILPHDFSQSYIRQNNISTITIISDKQKDSLRVDALEKEIFTFNPMGKLISRIRLQQGDTLQQTYCTYQKGKKIYTKFINTYAPPKRTAEYWFTYNDKNLLIKERKLAGKDFFQHISYAYNAKSQRILEIYSDDFSSDTVHYIYKNDLIDSLYGINSKGFVFLQCEYTYNSKKKLTHLESRNVYHDFYQFFYTPTGVLSGFIFKNGDIQMTNLKIYWHTDGRIKEIVRTSEAAIIADWSRYRFYYTYFSQK